MDRYLEKKYLNINNTIIIIKMYSYRGGLTTNKNDTASSEIIGTVLLLAIVVVTFSVLYLNILSDDGPPESAIVTIVGKLDNDNLVFEHQSGKPLNLDTTLFLSIGGQPYTKIIGDDNLLDNPSQLDGVWNVGEKCIFSDFIVRNLRVETKILDKKSNSLVWRGVLQEGDIIEELGAIWHFDENIGVKANDSLNNNTGELIPDDFFGPHWDDEISYGNSCLKFDGINDNVTVPGKSVSLDFSNNFTLEAWMNIPSDNMLEHYTYGPAFGYQPDIIHIIDDVYAIAYQDQQFEGTLKTIRITNDGVVIGDIYNNSFGFSEGLKCWWPNIIHAFNDLYLIAFTDNSRLGFLQTVSIAENGTISQSVNDTFQFGPKEVYEPDLIRISNNIFAMVFKNIENSTNKASGFIRTFEVSNEGIINYISGVNNLFEFVSLDDPKYLIKPKIIHVSGDIYSIVFSGDNNSGNILTIKIEENGNIANTIKDSFNFKTTNCLEPRIIPVSGDLYAIVYRDDNSTNIKKGFISTVEVRKNGLISKNLNDTLMFETDWCKLPKITHVMDDIYSIVYEGDKDIKNGYLTNVKIELDGSISNTSLSKMKFNIGKNYFAGEPDIIHIHNDVIAIAFRSGSQSGTPHEGHLITFRAGNPENPVVPPDMRGIYKQGCYGIYLNRTHVSAYINNIFISEEVTVLPNIWNHVVLILNDSQDKIFLYWNKNLIYSSDYYSSLNKNSNEILIGNSFFGYIDEVQLRNHAFTFEEVVMHYDFPGVR